MLEAILDLHIHSKYSRACSKDLVLPNIARACEIRGITIAATGDFTHPAWLTHLQDELVEDRPGLYRLKTGESKTRFIIGTEVSSIKKHAGETRRVHHLIFAPSLLAAEKWSRALEDRGCNLRADGRPILGLTSKDLLSLMLENDPRMVMIPAHAWTPWFGIFGSYGGYDALEECFEDLTPQITAIETGLSSDPVMNRRWSALDALTLISNSDAHSVSKLGREANVLQFSSEEEITYDEIMRIIREGDRKKFLRTIEFYPEEGKYHLNGHRACGVVFAPQETKKHKGICPTCKKPLTIGVLHRVEELADRSEEAAAAQLPIPYAHMVPLAEIIADALAVGASSKGVRRHYDAIVAACGSEFAALLHAPIERIAAASTKDIGEAVKRVRAGLVSIRPGYDGVFGTVKMFADGEKGAAKQGRMLFGDE